VCVIGPKCSLVPLIYWHDKTHLARTSHYRDFVFQSKVVKQGGMYHSSTHMHDIRRRNVLIPHALCYSTIFTGFIETTLGQQMLEEIKATGMGAHAKVTIPCTLPH
jgi:hypothetical protein